MTAETKSTSEVAALLRIKAKHVRHLAFRRGIKALGRNARGEALWPADRILELIPRRRVRAKP